MGGILQVFGAVPQCDLGYMNVGLNQQVACDARSFEDIYDRRKQGLMWSQKFEL